VVVWERGRNGREGSGDHQDHQDHQLVVRLGGALCDWPLGVLEAEVIGGEQGECEKENGRRDMGSRRKGLRHLSTAGLARGLGAWAGWTGWAGLG